MNTRILRYSGWLCWTLTLAVIIAACYDHAPRVTFVVVAMYAYRDLWRLHDPT